SDRSTGCSTDNRSPAGGLTSICRHAGTLAGMDIEMALPGATRVHIPHAPLQAAKAAAQEARRSTFRPPCRRLAERWRAELVFHTAHRRKTTGQSIAVAERSSTSD